MTGTHESALLSLVSPLLDGEVTSLTRLGGGGNNELFRIESAGRPFVIKRYTVSKGDMRDRIGQEYGALSFLTRLGEVAIPKPIAIDRIARIAIYEWIEGEPVTHLGNVDLNAALEFLGRLFDYRRVPAAADLPMASEACCDSSALERQILRRFERLTEISSAQPNLATFLNDTFVPAWESLRVAAFTETVGTTERTLSPSDFGRHNMLRRRDGSLVFLDFEYFGWDDPVKLVADTVWHPGSLMSREEGDYFIAGAKQIFNGVPSYVRRFRDLFPIFGLRWALIVLAEFTPEHWERRQIAGRSLSWESAKALQLEKAERLVQRSREIRG